MLSSWGERSKNASVLYLPTIHPLFLDRRRLGEPDLAACDLPNIGRVCAGAQAAMDTNPITRRACLSGLGAASVGLPFVETVTPASCAATGAATVPLKI